MNNLQYCTQQIEAKKQHLFSQYPIKNLAIFGSVSRGEEREDSDVDMLVEFEKPVGMKFIHLALELESIIGRKVDLVSRKGIKDKYFEAIKNDLIYV